MRSLFFAPPLRFFCTTRIARSVTVSDTAEPDLPLTPCPECGTPGKQGYGEVSCGYPGPPGSRLAYWFWYDCPACAHSWVISFDSGPLPLLAPSVAAT